ncbi:MAG TPA: hypothetical protein VFB15_03605 [Candidatus Binataceae bacterium]|jgi:hypothetical protein|nr:hypothetical protein [Candidatus Binataceae bacterium]
MAPNDAIVLDELQRAVLRPQVEAFMAAATDADSRTAFADLGARIDRREVPSDLAARLGALLEVLLSSGRVRKTYGPGAELSLWALYQKTPAGQALASSVDSVNRALQSFAGRTLDSVAIVARGPGAYALTLRTTDLQLVIRLDAGGARLESAELGNE